uniref:Integral membrane protein n=1 Tax=uncultured bacterium Contigcl_1738 TaxID=1393655 RepID=W0FM44_9BACT|nr:hypothetical protein [uncultured bacterium Contigcl_1738]
MKFPNAYKGIGKIYLAEILQLIGAILLAIGIAVGFFGMKSEGQVEAAVTSSLALGAFLSMLPGMILPMISLILSIIGLNEASKDEPTQLRTAFISSIAALALAIIAGVIQSVNGDSNLLSSFFELLSTLASLFVTIFTVGGISKLMTRIGRNDLVNRGNQILWLLVGAQVLEQIARMLPQGTFALVLSFAGLMFSVVMYFLYIGFLNHSRNALAI